jgi:hypothetical protein
MSTMLQKRSSVPFVSVSSHSSDADVVYFPIYSPWVVDTQGEAITDVELMAAAHDWMVWGRSANVDVEHDGVAVNCRVVESWVTRGKSEFGPAGTWAGGMRIYDDGLLESIRRGEINGVSLLSEYPPVRRVEDTIVESPVRAVGDTEFGGGVGMDLHSHGVDISFDDAGDEDVGFTDEVLEIGRAHV